jgi:hypothetical protein
MRELTTIGNVHALRRSLRAVERTARLRGIGIGYVGATNALYLAPSADELLAEPPGDALASATKTLLEHFATGGVPSEHVSDPVVLAWQKAVSADPSSWAQRTPKLGVDGGFGDNSHATAKALAAALGLDPAVPDVNTTTATVPYAEPGSGVLTIPTIVVHGGGKTTPLAPIKPAAAASSSSAVKWILGLLLAGGLAYGAHKMMKKRRARRRSAPLPSRAIVLT